MIIYSHQFDVQFCSFLHVCVLLNISLKNVHCSSETYYIFYGFWYVRCSTNERKLKVKSHIISFFSYTLFAVRLYILASISLNFSRSVSDNHLNPFFGKMYHYIQKSGRDTRPLLINFTRKLLQLTLRQKILLSSKPQMEKKS